MITTPEEYVKYLWGIETQEPLLDENGNIQYDENNEVIMHAVNPYNNKPILSVILPSDERTFDVDLDKREISVPTFLSVSKDHRAETIYFLVDRYYEYKDLSQTSCVVEFINAAGEGGYYVVPFYDISSYPRFLAEDNVWHEAKMLVPWCIEGNVTKAAGPVQFALRFYELDNANENFVYNLRTKVATAQVLDGMNENELDENVNMDLLANILEQFNSKIENPIIYWTDLDNPLIASGRQQDQEGGEDVDNYINILNN